jgi:hypothetical protein
VRKPLEKSKLISLVRLCALLRHARINHIILLEEKEVKEDVEEIIS